MFLKTVNIIKGDINVSITHTQRLLYLQNAHKTYSINTKLIFNYKCFNAFIFIANI